MSKYIFVCFDYIKYSNSSQNRNIVIKVLIKYLTIKYGRSGVGGDES